MITSFLKHVVTCHDLDATLLGAEGISKLHYTDLFWVKTKAQSTCNGSNGIGLHNPIKGITTTCF